MNIVPDISDGKNDDLVLLLGPVLKLLRLELSELDLVEADIDKRGAEIREENEMVCSSLEGDGGGWNEEVEEVGEEFCSCISILFCCCCPWTCCCCCCS